LNYQPRKSQNANSLRNARTLIQKAIKDLNVSNSDELLGKLKREKRQRDKAELEHKRKLRKEKSIEKKVNSLIDIKKLVTYPTMAEAKTVIKYADFNSDVEYARTQYIEYKQPFAFMKLHSKYYKRGNGYNSYFIKHCNEIKVEVSKSDSYYTTPSGYTYENYNFTLYMPKNYSFILLKKWIFLIEGKKLKDNGMEVLLMRQGDGLELLIEKVFLVKGVMVRKVNTIKKLIDAQKLVAKEYKDTQLERFIKLKEIF